MPRRYRDTASLAAIFTEQKVRLVTALAQPMLGSSALPGLRVRQVLGLWCLLAGVVAIEGRGCVACQFAFRSAGSGGMRAGGL